MREAFSLRLKSYLLWMLPVSLVFFGLYPWINSVTAGRGDTLALWLPAELALPFIPAFIWAYLSMYLIILLPLFFLTTGEQKRLAVSLMAITFVAALIFLLFPARLGFVRQLPPEPLYRTLFATLFALDSPHNLVPSLHVAWSYAAVLSITRRRRGRVRLALYLWFITIALSTLLVHQHHLLDVVTGCLLSLTVFYCTGKVYETNRSASVRARQP